MLSYQLERWADFVEDGKKLFPLHYVELALNQDKIKLDVDLERYANVDKHVDGIGHIITVRDMGSLVGYIVMVILPHLHYKSAGPMATTDAYYLLPNFRVGGTGAKMILYAIETLKQRGVVKIYWSSKVHQDHGPLLEALGFIWTDKIHTKLLV